MHMRRSIVLDRFPNPLARFCLWRIRTERLICPFSSTKHDKNDPKGFISISEAPSPQGNLTTDKDSADHDCRAEGSQDSARDTVDWRRGNGGGKVLLLLIKPDCCSVLIFASRWRGEDLGPSTFRATPLRQCKPWIAYGSEH